MPGAKPSAPPVTRLEVVGVLHAAFAGDRPAGPDDLLGAARDAGARDEVLALLRRLPASARLVGPGDLWNHLSEVPIGD